MDETVSQIERSQKIFLSVLAMLIVLGVVMVYSSSYIYAKDIYGNSAHYFYRQILFLSASVPICWLIAKTKITFWLKYGWVFHLGLSCLLVLTFVPGLGSHVKGANRWINIGSFSLQPGEMVKYSILLVAVPFFENFFDMTVRQRWIKGGLMALPLLLLILQPDFGTFTLCFVLIAIVCFLSSFPRKIFYSSLAVGIMGIIPILLAKPYRVRRLFAYLDPWKNPQTSGFQIIQSYLAFANGSIFGTGLGNSNEKLFYLPEAHNDFIFSVIGEELGFAGVMIVVTLFMLLIFFGLRLVTKLEQRTTIILATALIFTIGLQASLNMGVVLGLLPTKGMNLPFISAGGSSLIANFFAIGLFLSAIVQRKKELNALNRHSSFDHFKKSSDILNQSFQKSSSSSMTANHQTTTQGELF